jgi:hypothetical protein
MRLTLGMAALAATLAAASPASAQLFTAQAQAEARGTVLTAQSLTRDRDLDFGIITVDPLGAGGTVSVSAVDLAIRSISDPSITALGGTVSSARFQGYGAPSQEVSLSLTQPGNLVGPGGALIPATLVMSEDTSVTPLTLGSTGRFTVFVGGDFAIAPTQAAGLYSANFELTADFN